MIKYVLLIVLAIVICKCIYTTNKNNKEVGVLSGALFSFLIYYCIIPLLVLSNYSKIDNKTAYISTVYDSNIGAYLLFFVCALLLLLSITTSYKKSLLKYSGSIVSFAKVRKYSCYLFYFSFIIGTLAFVMYIRAFGGLRNALLVAELQRSFSSAGANLIPYTAALMKLPSALVSATPLFYAIWIGDSGKWNLKSRVVFIILLLINILYLLVNAGKTGIILFILPIFFTFLSYRTKHVWFWGVICCVLGVPFINVLDSLFLSFSDDSMMMANEVTKVDLSLLHQFAYPVSNALNMHEILGSSGLRFFKDFITGFLTHVPGLNYDPAYVSTSAFYGGRWWRDGGGTPNDIMTFGYLQFGPIGIIVVGIIWGYILGFLERYLKIATNSFSSRFIKYSLVLVVFNAVMNADISALVVNFKFSLLVLFIYMTLYRVKPNKNKLVN